MEQKEITISMEEYKELLIIKGKYEELKQNSLYIGTFTTKESPIKESPYGGPIISYCRKEE